jgi:hypothetical protein
MSQFKYDLGDRAKSRIDGFRGIIVGRTQYLNMCNRYTIAPEELKDGKPLDMYTIDEQDLVILDKHVHDPIPQQRPEAQESEAVASGGPPARVAREARP